MNAVHIAVAVRVVERVDLVWLGVIALQKRRELIAPQREAPPEVVKVAHPQRDDLLLAPRRESHQQRVDARLRSEALGVAHYFLSRGGIVIDVDEM